MGFSLQCSSFDHLSSLFQSQLHREQKARGKNNKIVRKLLCLYKREVGQRNAERGPGQALSAGAHTDICLERVDLGTSLATCLGKETISKMIFVCYGIFNNK